MQRARAALVVIALAAPVSASMAGAGASPAFPHRYELTGARVAHWTPVLRRVAAHSRPDPASRVVAHIRAATPEWTQNVLLVLRAVAVAPRRTWYQVRLPILPNGSTGWVPRSALGNLYAVHTHLYVNRARFTTTLKRDGRTIFITRVGVGRPGTPTPAGEFYVRDELTGYHRPFYGPVMIGTNARSAVLTDWPGGGFVGIHGTNRPEILPGAVSHGCVRMVNRAIVRLAKLMPVGTPVTIS